MAGKQINVILSLKDKLTKPLGQTAKQFKEMERVQKRAQNQMNKWTNGSINGLNKLSSKMVKTTGIVAGLVGAFAFKTGLTEAMNLEGYQSQLETAMKDTKKAAEMMRWAVAFANKTPFETGPVVEATAKLEMYGLAAKQFLPLAGDMAAGMNKDILQAVEAIADAQTGELERLKEFGIKKQDIQEKADAMFKKNSTINSKGQITNAEQFNKALQAIMVDKFTGGMDKQAKKLKGRLSTISGIYKTGMAKILGMGDDGLAVKGSAFESIGLMVERLAKKFETWQADGTLDRLQRQFSETFKKVSDAIKGTVDFVNKHPHLVKFVLSLGLSLMVAAKAVTIAQGLIGFFVALKAVTGGIAFLGMGPLGWIALGVAAIVMLITHWKELKATIITGWNYLSDKVPWLTKAMELGFKAAFGWVFKIVDGIKWVINNWGKIGDKIKDTAGKIGVTAGPQSSTVVPKNAMGTSNWRGGVTSLHERGGEIYDLPSGTRVYPHDKSVQMARNEGKSIQLIFQIENLIGDDALVDRVGEKVSRKVVMALANM